MPRSGARWWSVELVLFNPETNGLAVGRHHVLAVNVVRLRGGRWHDKLLGFLVPSGSPLVIVVNLCLVLTGLSMQDVVINAEVRHGIVDWVTELLLRMLELSAARGGTDWIGVQLEGRGN